MLELTGTSLKPQQHVDGVSLVPLLKGKEIDDRDLFWHYPHYGNQGGEPCAIIRSEEWKLIHYFEDGRDELYDIGQDIGEESDVLSGHPEIAKQLRKKLGEWLIETNAIIPQPDSRFDPEKKKLQLQNQRTQRLESLERSHAKYFE